MHDAFVSMKDIVAERQTSISTVIRLVKAGKLPEPERVGLRSVRWRRSVIEAAYAKLDNKKRPAAAPALAVAAPAIEAIDHLDAAAQWLASQEQTPTPVVPRLQAVFGLTALQACQVAARAFDLRAGQ